MAFSRRLGIIGLVGASWLVAVACNDDGDRKPMNSAKGGEAPSGGKATAGSANDAGKAGTTTAGNSGTTSAGDGGATSAGNGGMSGGGTMPVGGENTGGAGGAAGAEAGAGNSGAGAGGDGGAGGVAQTPAVKKCDFACNINADCVVGNVAGYCDPVLNRCRATDCKVTADCTPVASSWFVPCADDSECTPDTQRCVAWQGLGYCADLPDPSFPDFPCIWGSPTNLPLFGSAGTDDVCAEVTQVCSAKGACEPGCGSLGCDPGSGNTCNTTTGICECAASTECTKAGVSVCGQNALCGCASDNDCQETSAATGLDTCSAGTCGCDTAASCVNPGYANATAVCE